MWLDGGEEEEEFEQRFDQGGYDTRMVGTSQPD